MEKRFNWFSFGTATSVNLLSFAVGAAYSWSSPVLPKLKGVNGPVHSPMSLAEESWIASSLSLGATIGPILSAITSNKLGRKKTLLISSIPAIISHLVFAFANKVNYFIIGRFLIGLTSGCACAVIPIYIGEISTASNRGSLGCIMGIMLALGDLSAFVIGPFVSICLFSFINLVPLVLFNVLYFLLVPESPYYLISVGEQVKAANSLRKFHNKPDRIIMKEIMEITEELDKDNASPADFRALFTNKVLSRGLFITCGLMIFQQCSGICAVLGYMQSIFSASGSSLPEHISAILVALVLFVVNIAASLLVDILGRKVLLLASSLGIFLSQASLGIYFFIISNKYDVENYTWIPILSLGGFFIAYNIGFGPLPWVIMGELFPSNVKTLASTITSCVCLSLAFLVSMFFPFLTNGLGMAQTFWFFAAFSAVGSIFIIFKVPETKGMSFQEIQSILSRER